MREVFFSHASKDHPAARLLRDILVAHDVPVWFSPHHIRGAQQWHDEIGEALARCGWFMVLLTQHAVKSKWVQRELKYALTEKRYQERIIPLLFRKCDVRALSWTLPQFQMIDFTKDYWQGCAELLRVWRKPLKDHVRRKLERRRKFTR
jgi:TIR domain